MTIFERVAGALATLGVPYANQRYQVSTGEPLPDTYITYFLVSSTGMQYADNLERSRSGRIQVNVFSRNGLVNLPDVDAAMRAAGFLVAGKRQLPEDPQSGYFGLGQDYTFLEEN